MDLTLGGLLYCENSENFTIDPTLEALFERCDSFEKPFHAKTLETL